MTTSGIKPIQKRRKIWEYYEICPECKGEIDLITTTGSCGDLMCKCGIWEHNWLIGGLEYIPRKDKNEK